ncbi:ATP-binding protein [Planotetraspora thailandica]
MRLGWWQRAFPGDPGQLREVRRYVAGLLDGFPARDDVIACAAELASNAIVHTRSGNGGTFVVHVQRGSGCLRVAVADAGSDVCPVLRAVFDENLREGGRGLAIVAALSSRMQVDGDARGRTVWAEFRWPMGCRRPRRRMTPFWLSWGPGSARGCAGTAVRRGSGGLCPGFPRRTW